jgi:hypothetical protein
MTEIDNLMDRLAELDAKDVGLWTDKDIDDIIAYQRKNRALREAGVKVKKGETGAPKPKLTLASLGIKMAVKPNFTKRV